MAQDTETTPPAFTPSSCDQATALHRGPHLQAEVGEAHEEDRAPPARRR